MTAAWPGRQVLQNPTLPRTQGRLVLHNPRLPRTPGRQAGRQVLQNPQLDSSQPFSQCATCRRSSSPPLHTASLLLIWMPVMLSCTCCSARTVCALVVTAPIMSIPMGCPAQPAAGAPSPPRMSMMLSQRVLQCMVCVPAVSCTWYCASPGLPCRGCSRGIVPLHRSGACRRR